MNSIVKLLRVHQWIKNVFIFLPIFFSGELFNLDLSLKAFFAFILFSLTASLVYIINDYGDVEEDRLHPEKKKRPLASGAISLANARVIMFSIFAVIICLSTLALYYIPVNTKQMLLLIGFYFVMNLAYSYKLKQVAIVDITIIAFGFLLRVLVGGYATGIVVSSWAILLIFMLAYILAIGKRRGEILNAERNGKTRKSLQGYNVPFLDTALGMISALTVMCYIMYTFSDEAQSRFHQTIYFTVVFVLVGILRFLQQTFVFNRTESPTKLAYKDRFLQIVILLWILAFGVLIYIKGFSFTQILN